MHIIFYTVGCLSFIAAICQMSLAQTSNNDLSIILHILTAVVAAGFGCIIHLMTKNLKTNNTNDLQTNTKELTSEEKGKRIALYLSILFVILFIIGALS